MRNKNVMILWSSIHLCDSNTANYGRTVSQLVIKIKLNQLIFNESVSYYRAHKKGVKGMRTDYLTTTTSGGNLTESVHFHFRDVRVCFEMTRHSCSS